MKKTADFAIAEEAITAVSKTLGDLPPRRDLDRRGMKLQIVAALYPRIIEAREKGYTLREISSLISRELGEDFSYRTLVAYMMRLERAQGIDRSKQDMETLRQKLRDLPSKNDEL